MNQNRNNAIVGMLNQLFRQNPQMQTNPLARNMISVIQNGDNAKGEEIARNLCESYGVTPEEAYARAMQFFQRR